jgi:hypothetical protein
MYKWPLMSFGPMHLERYVDTVPAESPRDSDRDRCNNNNNNGESV